MASFNDSSRNDSLRLNESHHEDRHISELGSSDRLIVQARSSKVADPYDYCYQASLRLMDDLLLSGSSAQMLRCSGLRNEALDADSRWLKLGPQTYWVHFVVKLDDDIIDLTRRQFFPLSDYPFVQSYSDCLDEWDAVSVL